jgi:hypothetical protein
VECSDEARRDHIDHTVSFYAPGHERFLSALRIHNMTRSMKKGNKKEVFDQDNGTGQGLRNANLKKRRFAQ